MIIGLSGYARSGKDEAAKVLVEEYGFRRIAFADKLREVLYALNPIVSQYHYTTQTFEPAEDNVYVQDVIKAYGWDGYKETPFGTEIRRLLQRLGTEAGRQTLWDSIWVDAALHDVTADDDVVIPDTRFPNEYDAVKQRGGQVWRINRLGVGPANSHASETSLDDFDFDMTIYNDGSLEEFKNKIRVRIFR